MTIDNESDNLENPARRTALKGIAGAGVAAAVWAEPTIKGMMRRPAYASGASGFPSTTDVTVTIVMPAPGSPPMITNVSDTNPFGHGPLTFQTNYNSTQMRYRLRLGANQSGANAGATMDSFTISPTTDQSPNNPWVPATGPGWLRWENSADGKTFMVTFTVSCA